MLILERTFWCRIVWWPYVSKYKKLSSYFSHCCWMLHVWIHPGAPLHPAGPPAAAPWRELAACTADSRAGHCGSQLEWSPAPLRRGRHAVSGKRLIDNTALFLSWKIITPNGTKFTRKMKITSSFQLIWYWTACLTFIRWTRKQQLFHLSLSALCWNRTLPLYA